MRVELVTVGDELLLGFTIDTNAAYIARNVAELGVSVTRRATVGDDETAIGAAVADALTRADGVIMTGGLGPTADDLTVEAVAAQLGLRLVMHEPTLAALEERWRSRGLGPLPANARQQALVPEGAELLTNRHGTAPGIWIETRGKWIAMMPGVPREMRGLLADEVVPRIRTRTNAADGVVASRTLRTTGMAESAVADRVEHLPLPEGVSLAYLPSWEGVDLRVTLRGVPADVAASRLRDALTTLRAPLEAVAYGEDHADLAELVVSALAARSWTIAAGESCTGGLLMQRLTAIPGASEVMLGGVVAYHNDVKHALLGVDRAVLAAHGAVSEPVAQALASGARRATGATVGVGITGIAGPGGATPDKPVGTVCTAVEWPGGAVAGTARFPGDRAEIRLRATQAALVRVLQATGS